MRALYFLRNISWVTVCVVFCACTAEDRRGPATNAPKPTTAREAAETARDVEHEYAADSAGATTGSAESLGLPNALAKTVSSEPGPPQAPPVAVPADEAPTHEGLGPGVGGDKYSSIVENPFRRVEHHPLSTFSIDVDTASYANTRRFLLQNNSLPPAGAVRIEEFINYFSYQYAPPTDETPFATHVEVSACPWKTGNRLLRVGLKGREIENQQRPSSNLVFLLDVSGSMNSPDKLPLLQHGMLRLVDQLGENDRVAIVVYASASGLVLPSTPAYEKATIRDALQRLRAGGSTAGGAGIRLAYEVALQNFIEGGTNRIILATDGDFNVGTSSTAELVDMVEKKAKSRIFLTVLGFGRGNLNEAMMEEISNRGNGNFAYIDSQREAEKVLVDQIGGTLVTIAKDVKIQIEFNPVEVGAYRLIGYENRMLKKEDFNDDKKDAGEIGAGHTVTALYELMPPSEKVELATAQIPVVDKLEFQQERQLSEAANSGKLLLLKLRYKMPEEDESTLVKFPVSDQELKFGQASSDFKFACAVAGFGMLLRDSQHKGDLTYEAVHEIAKANVGQDSHGYRAELLEMIQRAKQIAER